MAGEELNTINELYSIAPGQQVAVTFTLSDGSSSLTEARWRLDTKTELAYYLNDGILGYIIRSILQRN